MMTFHFEKIGPVDSADITLGDLTIIAGRNNTGKTYLVYALYGFLKQWEEWEDRPSARSFFRDGAHDSTRSISALRLSRIVPELLESGRASVAMKPQTLIGVRQGFINRLADNFSARGLPAVFSSTPTAFADARLQVDLNHLESSGEHAIQALSVRRFGRVSLQYDGNEISFAIENETSALGGHSGRVLLRDVIYRLLFRYFCSNFPRPFILSAERFGISLFYKELDFTRSRLVDLLQNEGERDSQAPYLLIDKNTSRYARPIKDNIDYTRSIYEMQKQQSPLADEKLFDDIRDVMGGYYKASRDVISFRSKARGKRKFDIPLHLASSSARGLTDLYFYLRHRAAPSDLLIIDEPESHLDTRNQIVLARILARFVRVGIRILITTHSDYLIKEINNLIMLNEVEDDNSILRNLKYSPSDRLDPSSVRAYVVDAHQLDAVPVDEFGIDMPVFDETIDGINRASRALAEEVRSGRD